MPKKEEKYLTEKERLSPKLPIFRESFNEEHIISGNVRDHQVKSNVISKQPKIWQCEAMWQYGNVRDHQVRSNAVTNQRTEKMGLRPVSVKIQTSTVLYDILFHQQPNICRMEEKYLSRPRQARRSCRRAAQQPQTISRPKFSAAAT